MADPNSLAPPGYGYNPQTNHFVLKTGAVWKRLVKAGTVSDPELVASMAAAAAARRRPTPLTAKPVALLPRRPSLLPKAPRQSKLATARAIVAENQSELDDLESDVATELIASKLTAATLRSDSEEDSDSDSGSDNAEPPRRQKPPASRPIPIPATRAQARAAGRKPEIAELQRKLTSLGL